MFPASGDGFVFVGHVVRAVWPSGFAGRTHFLQCAGGSSRRGGNLATTLERLAAVIRDRVNYRRQLKAVTGASRVSVYVIAGLGPLLFAWLFVFNPEYGMGLWNDSTGRVMLLYAIISEIVGLAVVGWLLKADY